MVKKSMCLLFVCMIILYSCSKDIPLIQMSPISNLQINSKIQELLFFDKVDKSKIDSLLMKNIKTQTIVYSKTAHIAFTDFIRFEDFWYLSFRISDGHLPKKAANIIICKSEDLEKWEIDQTFSQDGYDLRDPKLFIHNDSLFIQFNSTSISPYGNNRNDYISKYDIESSTWIAPYLLNKNEDLKSWFWRISSINNKLYVGAYLKGKLRLFNSSSITDYHEIYKFDIQDYQLTESTLRAKESDLYALIRVNSKNALLGKSTIDDLTKWSFTELPWNNIGGPNFLIYKNHLLIGGRKNAKTALYKYNLNNNNFTLIGETSKVRYDSGYPGMHIENNLLYFTYYTSSDDDEFQINLSIIDLDEII